MQAVQGYQGVQARAAATFGGGVGGGVGGGRGGMGRGGSMHAGPGGMGGMGGMGGVPMPMPMPLPMGGAAGMPMFMGMGGRAPMGGHGPRAGRGGEVVGRAPMGGHGPTRAVVVPSLPAGASCEEICDAVGGFGPIESIELTDDRALVSFVDAGAAHGLMLRSGCQIMLQGKPTPLQWGRAKPVPREVLRAIRNGATRNLYVANLAEGVREAEVRYRGDVAEIWRRYSGDIGRARARPR